MTELTPRFAKEARTTAGEVPFQVREQFFTRTDKRGVIKAANSVFKRLSGYDWAEVIGAPHKIIRHPDMPKGAFHLMWQEIQAGRAFGVYVKNRDKTGRYYWVFALIAPVEGGYASIRIKPTSSILEQVAPIYARLLDREQQDGLTPEASAQALVKEIVALGYPSYHAFMATAMANEAEARARAIGNEIGSMQTRLLAMARDIADVEKETREITEAFNDIRTVPMNMRIIASRLENAGGPISAISVNYSQMLQEMQTWVTTFVEGRDCVFARIRDAILATLFTGFAAMLEEEIADTLLADDPDAMPDLDTVHEHATLDALHQQFLSEARASLTGIEVEAIRFGRSVVDMKRYVTGLSSTRMMCKIESAALSERGTALAGIVEQLDACQNEIERRLARIVELNSAVQSNTAMLRSSV